jgi:hypothetical protein
MEHTVEHVDPSQVDAELKIPAPTWPSSVFQEMAVPRWTRQFNAIPTVALALLTGYDEA